MSLRCSWPTILNTDSHETWTVAFKVYDMDRDGYISNGELFLVLKMMVGNNLKDQQLQQIVDKTIMEADQNGDGKLDFEEFQAMVANTDVSAARCFNLLLSCPDKPYRYAIHRSRSSLPLKTFSRPRATLSLPFSTLSFVTFAGP